MINTIILDRSHNLGENPVFHILLAPLPGEADFTTALTDESFCVR